MIYVFFCEHAIPLGNKLWLNLPVSILVAFFVPLLRFPVKSKVDSKMFILYDIIPSMRGLFLVFNHPEILHVELKRLHHFKNLGGSLL